MRTSASDEEAAAPTVVSVQTGALKLATLHRYVTGYGTVEPAPATADQPAAGAQLAAPSAGVVAKVNVIEGQHVEKGDVLVELNSGAATVDSRQQEVERQKKLYAQQNTSLKNLQDAEAQLAALQVTAPVSGTVTRLNVKPGEAVDVSTVVGVGELQARYEGGGNVRGLDAQRFAVGQPQTLQNHHPTFGRQTKFVSHPRLSLTFGLSQNPGRCRQAMPPHLFGKARQFARSFVELSPRYERAASLLAADIAQLRQFCQCLAYGDLADVKTLGDFLLARQTLVREPPPSLNFRFEDVLELVVKRYSEIFIENAD